MAAELDCNYPLLCRTPGTSSISSSSCRWQIQTFSSWIFSKHFSLLFYFLLNRSFHYSEFNRKFLLIFRVHRENTPAKASSMNQWLAQTHAHFIKLNYLLIIYGFQFASVDIPVRQLTHFSRSIFTLHFSSSIGLFFRPVTEQKFAQSSDKYLFLWRSGNFPRRWFYFLGCLP